MISSHVVSLALSLKLKAAGFGQGDSTFVWFGVPGEERILACIRGLAPSLVICAAPLASEVMEQLPTDATLCREDNGYAAVGLNYENDGEIHKDATMADALALLYLALRPEAR